MSNTKTIKMGDKTLTISKWKGRNKKEFTRLLNDPEKNEQQMMDSLVYSCIEEDVILSTDEFRYALSQIRAYSLGEEIDFEFYCDKCHKTFNKKMNISDIIRFDYKPLKTIKVGDVKIKLGNIKNKAIYAEKVVEDPLYDFLMRIDEINGNDTFSLLELEEIIDELELDVLEEIMKIYEDHRFKIDDINTVKCECSHEMTFKFDELPGFFPESWFEE
ncbi:hypothetical protein Va1_276 [Vibrio phage Va1]|nr:hypothetical protein Va1_276 [Vibrio phage Va1]